MHYFGKANFLNICYLYCHGSALHLCRWRRGNNFFRPPSGRFPIALGIFVPIAVVASPPTGNPAPVAPSAAAQEAAPAPAEKAAAREAAAPEEAAAQAAAASASAPLVAAWLVWPRLPSVSNGFLCSSGMRAFLALLPVPRCWGPRGPFNGLGYMDDTTWCMDSE